MSRKETSLIILDANVLIDFVESDPGILSLVSNHIGELIVPTTVWDEFINGRQRTSKLKGITVVEPETEILLEAKINEGALSFADWTCLLQAQKYGCRCMTNDVPLRRECETRSISVIWGLEAVVLLVKVGKLDPMSAIKIAEKIHESNPKYIGREVIKDFRKKIALETRRKK